MASSLNDLLIEIQDLLSKLEAIGFGSKTESISHNGVVRPSIANVINQNFLSIKAMIEGRQSFATKALMDADLAHDTDVIAIVWDDPIAEYNGLYGKLDVSGSGSWKKSSYDDYEVLKVELTNTLNNRIASSNSVLKMPWGYGFLEVVVDEDGYILRGIKEDLTAVSVSDLVPVRRFIPWTEGVEFSVMLIDDDDVVVGYYTAQGQLIDAHSSVEIEPWQSDGLSHVVYSADDVLLHGYDEHGALVSPNQTNWAVPYIKNNELYSTGGDTKTCASGGDFEILSARAMSENLFQAAWLKPSLGDSQRVTTRANLGYLIPDDFSTLHVIIGYGQSLSVGAQGVDLLSEIAPFPDDVLMFGGDAIDVRMGLKTLSSEFEVLDPALLTGFQSLKSMAGAGGGSRGQTVFESMGHELSVAARAGGSRWHGLFFHAGLGGAAYSGIKKGTGPYLNLVSALERAKELAESQGLRIVVDGIVFIHGEADSGNSSYAENLIEMQVDLDADIKAITNQAADVPMFMNQPSSFFSSGVDSAKAFYDVHKSSEHHILVAPNYDLNYSEDELHLTGAGYFMLGERFYNSFLQTVWQGVKWQPLMPETITRIDNTITIKYFVPVGELEIDEVSFPDAGQYGFEFYNDIDGIVAISSVSKTGPDELTLIVSGNPIVGNSVLRYGLSGHVGTRLASTQARGNIRDSSNQLSRHNNLPLYNWGVHFEENV